MGYVCLFVCICSGSGFIHYSVCVQITDAGCVHTVCVPYV